MTAWGDDWTTGEDDGELGTTTRADVNRIPAGYSPITEIAQEHMDWSERLIEALEEETGAQVEYDDVYHDELVRSHRDKVQMAIIKDITLSRCKTELANLTRAEGKVKRLKVKVAALDRSLMAEMSVAKYSGLADGGTR